MYRTLARNVQQLFALRLGERPAQRKRGAQAIGTFALVGVVLHCIDDDRGEPLFVASKWSLTRELGSIAEVDAFLRGIGGADA